MNIENTDCVISLDGVIIESLYMENHASDKKNFMNFNLGYSRHQNTDNELINKLVVNMTVENKNKSFVLDISVAGFFTFSKKLEDEVMEDFI